MVKKKNGFTMVELLGVIVIIGIILLIAIPAVTIFLKKSKSQYYDTTIDNIKSATEQFLIDYPDLIPEYSNSTDSYTTELYLKNLVDLDYIASVKDPNTKKVCDMDSYIVIRNIEKVNQKDKDYNNVEGANKNLQIDICLKCGDDSSPSKNSKCSTVKKKYAIVTDENQVVSSIKLFNKFYYPTLMDLENNTIVTNPVIRGITSFNEKIVVTDYGKIISDDIIQRGELTGKTVVAYNFKQNGDYYNIPLTVESVDELVYPTAILTDVEKIMFTPKTSKDYSVYVTLIPYNASDSLSCSIITTSDKKTFSGGAGFRNSIYSSRAQHRNSCFLTSNFAFTSASTATASTTDTYLRIEAPDPEKADPSVSILTKDIPIYLK